VTAARRGADPDPVAESPCLSRQSIHVSKYPPAQPWLYPTFKTEGQGPARMPCTRSAKR
jgi:hypothetical protein